MNYAELTAAICSYTENTFPDTTLPDGSTMSSAQQLARFVQQAEQRIYNSVQFPSLRKNVTGATTPFVPYVDCPPDFLSAYSMAIILPDGAYTFLLNKDVNFIREAFPAPLSYGTPKHYALFGPSVTAGNASTTLSFLVGPTPDAIYPVELHYYYYPDSIVTAGDTWLSQNFDSVLLYGSLVEAYTYMKGETDLLAAYEMKYKEALALAKRLGDGLERQDAYRSGQFRQTVT